MAKSQLEIEIKGTDSVGKAAEKVTSLRQELKKMKDQLASGQLSGAEFERMSQRAGQLQDAIGDVNQKVKNLASDTKYLDGFVSVTQGIVGGFTAAQGAIALFGDENEDLQKTLVKVQGSVALLNGFQQVANTLNKDSAAMTLLTTTRYKVLTAVKQRYAQVVGTTTGALKALRIAGAALGIGLIVTAVGALVANFDKLKNVVMRFIPGLSTLSKWFTVAKNAVTDFLGITSEQTRAYDELEKATEKQITATEREIEILKARGASIQEIWKAERSIIDMRLKLLQEQVKLNGKLNDEQIKEAEELQHKKRVLDETYYKQKSEAEKKSHKETKKNREEAFKQEQQDAMLFQYEQHKMLQEARQKEWDDEIAELERQAADELEREQKVRQFELEWKQRQQEEDQKFRDATIEAENTLNSAKRGALEAGFNIAQQFAGKNKALANSLFALQKGVAIAQVIIDTQKEIAGITANPTLTALPDAGLTAKAALITAAKIRAATSIATIAATAIGRGSAGGSGGGGSAGGSTPARSTQPQVSGFFTTPAGNQTGGTQPIKVFVTETDIRNATGRTNSIYSQARVE